MNNPHFKNFLIAASSLIPIAGGPLSVIIDKYIPLEIELRRNNFIDQLSNDFNKYNELIDLNKIQTPEYTSVFLNILQQMIKEHRTEKLVAFRNILINEAISKSEEFDELTFYIKLLDNFTVDQIRILNFIYKGKLKGHCAEGQNNSLYVEIQEQWVGVDKHYLRACVTELIRNFIISSSNDKDANKQHILTGFGERFVNYIFTPIEL